MAVIDVPDRMTLTAPAPDAVAAAGVQTVGKPALGNFFYWIVTQFPIGVVVSEPFPVWNAPQPMNGSNYVLIVWPPSAGAISYDLLRTDSPRLPDGVGNYALATGLTTTQFQDQGQALSSYDVSGLPRGAPVSCLVHLNNRDYSAPVMEMPCTMKVSTLIFPDGTTQTTAGGAAIKIKGSVPNHGALPPTGNDVGDAWITQDTGHMWVWDGTTWVDAGPAAKLSAAGSNGQIQFNDNGVFGASPNLIWNNANGRLGVRVTNPQTGLQVNDTVYVTGSTSSPTSGAGVEVWYDAAVGTPPGQGGIDAYDFSSAAYKRFFLDGDPLLLNSDLNSTGNIGVHNNNPQCALDVNGVIGATNVGIGLTNPTAKIQITATGGYDAFHASSTGLNASVSINMQHDTFGLFSVILNSIEPEAQFMTAPARAFSFITGGGASRLYISATGSVGVGDFTNVAQPLFELDVKGDINCRGQYRVNGAPVSMGGAQVGATPPASPNEGDFWYDSTNFRLFIRHSNAWFQVSA